jgi:ferrous iron transport protein B
MHEAARLLSLQVLGESDRQVFDRAVIEHVHKDHEKLDFLGIDRPAMFVGARYEWIRDLCRRAVTHPLRKGAGLTDRMDRIVTHRVFGPVIFLALMGLMFQSIFSWATIPMNLIADAFDWLGAQVVLLMPPGDLRDLLVKGALAGVSAVVTFLPQIAFLFLFLGVLEDSGYMARAAFIMDKLMGRVGLHGKSFIPLLGSFACAIPGIMATRTIETPRDRLVTMLVAPLMSCSARLPVYSLLIAAFIPPTMVFGVFSLPAITLLSLYLLGMGAALAVAMLFKKTLLRGTPPPFILELPPYRLPSARTVLLQVIEKSLSFLKTAGTIILGASILIWFLATYPKSPAATSADRLQQSCAGTVGRFIEPALRPLGFDWKIGIGLVTSVLQRESFVSAMATIYNVENDAEGTLPLHKALREDVNPATGGPSFTLLTALCVMVYYVLAMQCLSTVAIMRRETGGWKWPFVQIAYMTALAYGTTFLVYRAGLWMGLGG